MEFIRRVRVSWDETRVLNGRPTEFITIAHRSRGEWFIGCLSNWEPRDLELPLDFLAEGNFTAEIYADDDDAGIHPKQTEIRRLEVARATKLKMRLPSGDGGAVRIRTMPK